MPTTSIAEYLELPRSGQCYSANERVSGVGPCVEIFGYTIYCRPEDYARIRSEPHTRGMKLFEDDDYVKFLLHLQPNSGYYLALSGRALSVFCTVEKVTRMLCKDDDEIIGHGKIEEMEYKKGEGTKRLLKFKLLVVFKSGWIRRLTVAALYADPKMRMTIKCTVNKSAAGNLIAAPIIDKSSLVLIYEDTIVKGDGTVCRGTPAEGRKVIFAEGGFPWKSRILLITDDGEAHYAKMTGKVGDGKMPLFGSGKTTRSTNGLDIKEPTCACLWDSNNEIVVGDEEGYIYLLEKDDLKLVYGIPMEFGNLTFLQSRGQELWIGAKDGSILDYNERIIHV